MALSASGIYEIRENATAANVNAGYFNPTNANMMTDLAADSNTGNTNSPVVSSATYNFVAADVDHWLYVQAGTSWTPGWYKIASVAANKATLTATIGTAVQFSSATQTYNANTVAGCATVGTPTGGTFTIDYSQANASPFASTDLAVVTTTTLTSASKPFTKAMVGNGIHITAGTAAVGWYEIVSVAVVTATIDRSATTTGVNNTAKVGGALSLQSSTANQTDDHVFELILSSATAGTRVFIQNGFYGMGGSVSQAAAGNTAWWPTIEGYATLRGDRPKGSTRPVLAWSTANSFTVGARMQFISIKATGGVDLFWQCGNINRHIYCTFYNLSETATRRAVLDNTGSVFLACEFVSVRGVAIRFGNGVSLVFGCYIHDSDKGVQHATGGSFNIIDSIFACNVTSGLDLVTSAPVNNGVFILGNTFYGEEAKLGIGINILTASRAFNLYNNIFYGLTTGITHPDVQDTNYCNHNNFYNNTNDVSDVTHWIKGINDKALDPVFTNMVQRQGTTATTTAGNHLVDTTALFQTWGIQGSTNNTASGDWVRIRSGTGPTACIYAISTVDSETQLTVFGTLTANATADKSWSITAGRNFAIGTNLKGLGFPASFSRNGDTTNYRDIGAVQRQEAATGGSFTFG